jgi:hypothetical protein
MKPATLLPVIALLTAPAPTLHAQSEAALKEHFEGRTVRVKLAMPGTEDGVDVYPGTPRPLDFSRHADRLKDYGTALRAGAEAMVTKGKVKSKLIEFQLDGGGYGTSGDETSSSISVASVPKTKREQNLEGELKRVSDPARRREIKEELDDLRAERAREDARNRASVAEAEETRKANIRQRRLEGGSRFNIRFRDRVPPSALTPEAVRTALAAYVEFPDTTAPAASHDPGPASGGLPRRGMQMDEVDRLLGEPRQSKQRMEGRLQVTTRLYDASVGRVAAEFVEGVLIRYTITSGN